MISFIVWNNCVPDLTGTYLVRVKLSDGKIVTSTGLYVHPSTSPYKGIDWRDIGSNGEVIAWARLPDPDKLLNITEKEFEASSKAVNEVAGKSFWQGQMSMVKRRCKRTDSEKYVKYEKDENQYRNDAEEASYQAKYIIAIIRQAIFGAK